MAEQKYVHLQFANQEKKDWDFFKEFTEKYPKHFHSTVAGEYGTIFDGLNQDITGGTSVVEIKGRDRKALKYPTIMIEDHKYERMKDMWETCGLGSFYLNIFGDGYQYMLFDMPQIFESGKKLDKELMKIKFRNPDGTFDYKEEWRYFLPIEYASVFDSDLMLVKKPILKKRTKKSAAYIIDFQKIEGEISKKQMKNLCNTQK